MSLARKLSRRIFLTLGLLLPIAAWAFDLDQLSRQLTTATVVRGQFVQEKYLRALPQPLVSHGDFVLANGIGMLWQLRSPIAQMLRITPQGIARQLPDGTWQAASDNSGREGHLFLSLLAGDTKGLAKNFDVRLDGTADNWRMLMTPNSMILRQIFTQIDIHGGTTVQSIELRETQGDRTILRMENTQIVASLNDDERRALGD